jgi:hypothetical protein
MITYITGKHYKTSVLGLISKRTMMLYSYLIMRINRYSPSSIASRSMGHSCSDHRQLLVLSTTQNPPALVPLSAPHLSRSSDRLNVLGRLANVVHYSSTYKCSGASRAQEYSNSIHHYHRRPTRRVHRRLKVSRGHWR